MSPPLRQLHELIIEEPEWSAAVACEPGTGSGAGRGDDEPEVVPDMGMMSGRQSSRQRVVQEIRLGGDEILMGAWPSLAHWKRPLARFQQTRLFPFLASWSLAYHLCGHPNTKELHCVSLASP